MVWPKIRLGTADNFPGGPVFRYDAVMECSDLKKSAHATRTLIDAKSKRSSASQVGIDKQQDITAPKDAESIGLSV